MLSYWILERLEENDCFVLSMQDCTESLFLNIC